MTKVTDSIAWDWKQTTPWKTVDITQQDVDEAKKTIQKEIRIAEQYIQGNGKSHNFEKNKNVDIRKPSKVFTK